MKRRFSDEQIIGMIKEYEAGVKGAGTVPEVRHQRCDILQIQGQVWRDERVGRQEAEGPSRTRTIA